MAENYCTSAGNSCISVYMYKPWHHNCHSNSHLESERSVSYHCNCFDRILSGLGTMEQLYSDYTHYVVNHSTPIFHSFIFVLYLGQGYNLDTSGPYPWEPAVRIHSRYNYSSLHHAHTRPHTGAISNSQSDYLHVFGQSEETGEPGGNPHVYRTAGTFQTWRSWSNRGHQKRCIE